MDKIATIVPLHNLKSIEDHQYFMALSHCCENADYIKFFQKQSITYSDKYTILDNSAVEMEVPESFETYIEKACAMNAFQIMLPDWFRNPHRTFVAAAEALDYLERTGLRGAFDIMVIPQGDRSTFSWIQNAIELVHLVKSSGLWKSKITIGITTRNLSIFGNDFREFAIRGIKTYYLSHIDNLDFHLLGSYIDPRVEVAPLLEMDYVRGVDSSYPSIYTQHGIAMTPESFQEDRPERNIDFLEDEYPSYLLENNIRIWRRACLGELT